MSSWMMRLFGAVCALLLVFSAVSVRAQDSDDVADEAVVDDDVDVVAAAQAAFAATASDLVVGFVLNPATTPFSHQVLMGEVQDLLVGIHNVGNSTYNLTGMDASIRYPQAWEYAVQNLSGRALGVLIAPGQELSLLYRFMASPMLEPKEWGMTSALYYVDENDQMFRMSFMNITVDLVDSPTVLDQQMVMLAFGAMAVAAAAAYWVQGWAAARSERKAPHKARVEVGTAAAPVSKNVDENPWLKGTAADPAFAKKNTGGSGVKKSKKH